MANIPAAEPLIQTLLAVVIDFQSNPFYHNWKLLVLINVYAEIRQYKTRYLLSHLIHSFAIISREKSTENREGCQRSFLADLLAKIQSVFGRFMRVSGMQQR